MSARSEKVSASRFHCDTCQRRGGQIVRQVFLDLVVPDVALVLRAQGIEPFLDGDAATAPAVRSAIRALASIASLKRVDRRLRIARHRQLARKVARLKPQGLTGLPEMRRHHPQAARASASGRAGCRAPWRSDRGRDRSGSPAPARLHRRRSRAMRHRPASPGLRADRPFIGNHSRRKAGRWKLPAIIAEFQPSGRPNLGEFGNIDRRRFLGPVDDL